MGSRPGNLQQPLHQQSRHSLPAYDSPMSKWTSGIAPAVPLTANSIPWSAFKSLIANRARTLSTGGCDYRCRLVHSALALDVLHLVRGASKLRPGKIKLLANRLGRITGSNAGREAANGQKRGNELHVGCSWNLTRELLGPRSGCALLQVQSRPSIRPRRHLGAYLLQRGI